MASLSLSNWEKFVPALGNNKDQPKPFFLLVKKGLSRTEFQAHRDTYKSWLEANRKNANPSPDDLVKAFESLVRMGAEPLEVNGTPIQTLAELFAAVMGQENWVDFVLELIGFLNFLNAVEGHRELFFERLSGGDGFTSTTVPAMAAQDSGSGTSR